MQILNDEQIQKVQKRLLEFAKANPSVSFNDLAKNIGGSSTKINLFAHGKYKVSQEMLSELAAKVEDYLDSYTVIESQIRPGRIFAKTSVAEDVFTTTEYVRKFRKIGVVFGIPGCGRTMAVKEYARTHPRTILVMAHKLITKRSLLTSILRELKKSDDMILNNMFEDIIADLKGTDRLLIVDEGEHLSVDTLEIVRRIYDFAGIPILLSGTNIMLQKLRGRKGELKQLYSRIGIKAEVNDLTISDTKKILEVNYPDAVQFYATFHSVSKMNGRILENLMDLVREASQTNGEKITDSLIDQAASMLLT